jgi:hypothetical protein
MRWTKVSIKSRKEKIEWARGEIKKKRRLERRRNLAYDEKGKKTKVQAERKTLLEKGVWKKGRTGYEKI